MFTGNTTVYAHWATGPSPSDVTDVDIILDSYTIGIGESVVMRFVVFPADAVVRSIVWSSTDLTVLSVVKNADNSATVTGLKYGSATVTLEIDGVTAAVDIFVVYKPSVIDESRETAVI